MEAERAAAEHAEAKAKADASKAQPKAGRGEKLPKVLLREACDRLKRPPPRFRETQTPDNMWHAKCVLPDKKVANDDIVCLTKHKWQPQANAMEASQMAAVMALHRIASETNMRRILNARYQPLWDACDEGRAERAERAAMREEREARRKVREARQAAREEREQRQVTSVYMGADKMAVIQELLVDGEDGGRSGAIGAGNGGNGAEAADGGDGASGGADGHGEGVHELATQLQTLGFGADDADAAAARHPGDQPAALDWLLLTLDEGRLPARFAASASRVHVGIKVKRSAAPAGEVGAIDQDAGAGGGSDAAQASVDPGWPDGGAGADTLPEAAEEELEALESIYSNEFLRGGGGEAGDGGRGSRGGAVPPPAGRFALHLSSSGTGKSQRREAQLRWGYAPGYPDAPLAPRVAALRGMSGDDAMALTAVVEAKAAQLAVEGCVSVFELAEIIKEALEVTASSPASVAAGSRKQKARQPRAAAQAPQGAQRGDRDTRKARPRQQQHGPSAQERKAESERLQRLEGERQAGKGPAVRLAAVRARLPAAASRAEVLGRLEASRVLIIHGATGCGKSTQVPQFILEAAAASGAGGTADIVVTQPRRISAVGVAERVAQERGEPCGDTVGYSVRLDRKASRRTRLMFCTTGVLLRRMQSDPTLTGTSHVVVDEVHERSVDCDLLLLLLREALARNKALKVVLMSATLDAAAFAEYFAPALSSSPPVVTIPGFTHPVRDLFLEDVFELTGYRVGAKSRYAKRDAKGGGGTAAGVPSTVVASAAGNPANNVSGTDGASAGSAQQRLAVLADAPKRLESREVDDWEDDSDDDRDDAAAAAAAAAAGTRALEAAAQRAAERANAAAHAEAREVSAAVRELDAHIAGNYSAETQRSLLNVDDSLINYDLIEQLVAAILEGRTPLPEGMKSDADGAILVFLPGMAEIRSLQRQLEGSDRLRGAAWVVPLHGSLPPKEQRRVFDRPPSGQRKVVLSTNVAETSITIDDVTTVIDAGRAREVQYDPARRLSALCDAWCSRNAAKQRRGRAGRARPGVCFRTYSSRTFATDMPEANPPEVLRVPLERLCMQILSAMPQSDGAKAASVGETLAGLLTPPPAAAVASAMGALRGLSAVSVSPQSIEALTPLGRHLCAMPLDAPLGKMLLFGAMLRCLDPLLKIAAALGAGRSLFLNPQGAREEADAARRKFAMQSYKSDHIAALLAFNGWLAARRQGAAAQRQYVEESFLSAQVLREMDAARFDLLDTLSELGFVPRGASGALRRHERQGGGGGADGWEGDPALETLLRNAGSARVVKAVLCAGLYPSVCRVEHPKAQYTATASGAVDKATTARKLKLYTREDGRVFLHPSSSQFHTGKFESKWLVFSKRMQTSKVFLHEVSMVPPYAMLIFGGTLDVRHEEGRVIVGGWATFEAPARIGVLVRELRARVDRALGDKLARPDAADLGSDKLCEALCALLDSDGH